MNKLHFSFFTALLALSFLIVSGTFCFAGESRPFQASLTPDVAIHDRHMMIEGLALSIWGENPQKALALGVVNGSVGESSGFSLSLLANYADNYKGVHWALVNYTKADFLGWQAGFINYTESGFKGVQTGCVNYAGHLKGVQFGLVNYASDVGSGLQLGLINIIPRNEWFSEFPDALAKGMVLINWRF